MVSNTRLAVAHRASPTPRHRRQIDRLRGWPVAEAEAPAIGTGGAQGAIAAIKDGARQRSDPSDGMHWNTVMPPPTRHGPGRVSHRPADWATGHRSAAVGS